MASKVNEKMDEKINVNINVKMVIALVCGMCGSIFMCAGDWLMIYGDTTYEGEAFWLTEGVANMPAWRNSLSMFVAFPAVILYGIALFAMASFINGEKQKKIHNYLNAFGLAPWLCLHLFFVMIMYAFAWLMGNGFETAALPVAEAMRAHLVWIVGLSEVYMLLPFFYWFYLQFTGKTIFPKWMAFTNVIIIYVVMYIVNSLMPDTPFRLGFTNGMMNQSMFIWFGIMLVFLIVKVNKKVYTK